MSFFLTLWLHDWPCRNFHLHGECEAGENCKYSHEELTDETRPLLDVVRRLALFDEVISYNHGLILTVICYLINGMFSVSPIFSHCEILNFEVNILFIVI